MANVPGGQHVAGPSSHASTDTVDPITKFKVLVPNLKESLQVLRGIVKTIQRS